MKEMVKYGIILGVICFLASAVLAVVNNVTEPKIKAQKEKEENLALKEVVSKAVTFKPYIAGDEVVYYSAYDEKNRLCGFVIKSIGRGYSSDIEVLTGLKPDLEITNIKVLSQNETPGLGARVTEPEFEAKFIGKNSESLNDVQAITGATISSNAVINSIRNKISELKNELLKEAGNAK